MRAPWRWVGRERPLHGARRVAAAAPLGPLAAHAVASPRGRRRAIRVASGARPAMASATRTRGSVLRARLGGARARAERRGSLLAERRCPNRNRAVEAARRARDRPGCIQPTLVFATRRACCAAPRGALANHAVASPHGRRCAIWMTLDARLATCATRTRGSALRARLGGARARAERRASLPAERRCPNRSKAPHRAHRRGGARPAPVFAKRRARRASRRARRAARRTVGAARSRGDTTSHRKIAHASLRVSRAPRVELYRARARSSTRRPNMATFELCVLYSSTTPPARPPQLGCARQQPHDGSTP